MEDFNRESTYQDEAHNSKRISRTGLQARLTRPTPSVIQIGGLTSDFVGST
jgi:hypothetical protein